MEQQIQVLIEKLSSELCPVLLSFSDVFTKTQSLQSERLASKLTSKHTEIEIQEGLLRDRKEELAKQARACQTVSIKGELMATQIDNLRQLIKWTDDDGL